MGQGDKKGCWDVDECKTNAHNCIPGSQICHNVHANEGKYICIDIPGAEPVPCQSPHACPAGYSCFMTDQAPYYTCVDNNECRDNTDTCTIHQSCDNIPGSFECLGLADPNDVCTSFNPCAGNTNGNTKCVVMYNTYQCIDQNECEDGTHSCQQGDYCIDVPGSFICKAASDPDPYGVCSSNQCQANSVRIKNSMKKVPHEQGPRFSNYRQHQFLKQHLISNCA